MSNENIIFLVINVSFLIINSVLITIFIKKNNKKVITESLKEEGISFKELFAKANQEIVILKNNKEELEKYLRKQMKEEFKDQLLINEEKFKNLANQLQEVDKLFLGSNKKIGDWGSDLLERMLNIICNTKLKGATIVAQETIGNNKIPDIIIKSDNNIYPPIYIDAKFSKPAYIQYLESKRNDEDKRKLADIIKSHIDDINHKYIIDDIPFAIMFIPAEVIYEELINNIGRKFGKNMNFRVDKQNLDFLDYCFSKKVIPTSPATIIGVLTTFERYFGLFKKVNEVDEKAKIIASWISKKENFKVEIANLSKTIVTLYNNVNSLNNKWRTLERENQNFLHETFTLPHHDISELEKELSKN